MGHEEICPPIKTTITATKQQWEGLSILCPEPPPPPNFKGAPAAEAVMMEFLYDYLCFIYYLGTTYTIEY